MNVLRQHWCHRFHTLMIKIKLSFAHTSKSGPKPKHNPMHHIHFNNYLPLTLAHTCGMTLHHHHGCHPCLTVLVRLNWTVVLNLEKDPQSKRINTLPLELSKSLTITLPWLVVLTPHLDNWRQPCLTIKLMHHLALPVISEPEANSIHNANVPVYQSEQKTFNPESDAWTCTQSGSIRDTQGCTQYGQAISPSDSNQSKTLTQIINLSLLCNSPNQ